MSFYCSKCWRKPCVCKFVSEEPEHAFKFAEIGGGMLDQIICSCGWESATFFDGAEYAHSEWKRHVVSSGLPSHQQGIE